MKFSTRARYGTRALLDLAMHSNPDSTVTLKEIAQRQAISVTYLEQLVKPLIDGGIIRSIRGNKGGITLAKPAYEITVKEIFSLLEGPTVPVECLKHSNVCSRSGFCAAQEVWDEVGKAIDRVLESRTIQDLAQRQKDLNSPGDYSI
ncbi:MAG TPA: Rrf2 family transcriptional regulator [Candidatus Limnocylindrales bacterium]|nr:Rrf2 family transcriptional regulator [Candidatus Limnocylindrales bacterium]